MGIFQFRVPIEKAADDAQADWLSGGRRRRKLCRGKAVSDDAADHVAVDLLQRAVVFALIGKQERVPCTEGLDQVALKRTALNVGTQFAQLHFIGRTALRNFLSIPVDDRKLGEIRRETGFRVTWIKLQCLGEVGTGLLVATDFQETVSALSTRPRRCGD